MYIGKGNLIYSGGKLALLIDKNLTDYYFSLIPKYYYPNRQLHKPHITIVRSRIENPQNLEKWGKYEGDIVEYEYDGVIHYEVPYFYINCFSERFCQIREELGLERFRIGFSCFHFTIGNIK